VQQDGWLVLHSEKQSEADAGVSKQSFPRIGKIFRDATGPTFGADQKT
jgi:hypothetical protein